MKVFKYSVGNRVEIEYCRKTATKSYPYHLPGAMPPTKLNFPPAVKSASMVNAKPSKFSS